MTDRVLIICPYEDKNTDMSEQAIIDEAQGLCRALNLIIDSSHYISIKRYDPSTYLTKGHLDNIKKRIDEAKEEGNEISLLYIDGHIKPGQQRDLEKYVDLKVVDRTGLILEIFADRANTQEGRIQVDLAYKKYQKSRVVRAWSHLERQRGGGGFIGGPGEKQTELDRRALDVEIRRLEKDLAKIKTNRALQRQARERESFPVIALVGYTNAGKSTLFNLLTKSDVLSKDMLFATLDPTMRSIKLPNGQTAILSDTVGFIRNLPTELVSAFSATLEEVVEADIILHVHDCHSEDFDSQADTVQKTLEDLGIDYESDPIIQVYNKVDLLEDIDPIEASRLVKLCRRDANSVAVSAVKKTGIQDLLHTLVYHLLMGQEEHEFVVPVTDGKAIAWLHSNSTVETIEYGEEMAQMSVVIGDAALQKFIKVFGYEPLHYTKPQEEDEY